MIDLKDLSSLCSVKKLTFLVIFH